MRYCSLIETILRFCANFIMPKYTLREPKGNSFIEHILHSRGILRDEDKQAFLNPNYDAGTHDPFLLKDMQKVVDRILKAVEAGEKICIYSDFDADGIPGAVVLHDFFKKISYENFENYIPHRHREGFGIHVAALDEIALGGSKLVISIDCGIADVESARHAKKLGMDLIITDHHSPGDILPEAFAIINPKQPGCEYPEKMLCGSGVIFKVVQALCQTIRKTFEGGQSGADYSGKIRAEIKEGWEKWLLDMVGIATLSDMVPLTGENRIFAYFGLMVLKKTPRLGLIKLFKSLKIDQRYLTEEDITFMITPRINAASRMADPKDAFVLLSTTNETEADEAVKHLNKINDERKTQVAILVKDIKRKIEERGLDKKSSIVLGSPDWKPAVLGLVATNIVRQYNKAVFLWGGADAEEGEEIRIFKGSCRSPEGVDVVKIMRAIPEGFFINAGGHVATGGYSIDLENIHFFEEKILSAFDAVYGSAKSVDINDIDNIPDVLVDKLLDPSEVGNRIWSDIEKMSPYGEANSKPLFLLQDIIISEHKIFGKSKEHLEVVLQNPLTGKEARAIKFFAAEDKDLINKLQVGQIASLVAHMEKSMFKRYPEYRLRIVDII